MSTAEIEVDAVGLTREEHVEAVRRAYDEACINRRGGAALLELPSRAGAVRRGARMLAMGYSCAQVIEALQSWQDLYGHTAAGRDRDAAGRFLAVSS